MANKHERWELTQMQSLPLELKIKKSQQRIREWYDYFDGNVYLSFSGGKDSTVLKHLVENTPGVYDVPSVFIDTGLEYPEVRMFATKNADVILRPEMRFDEVIKKYGYPVISKEVSNTIRLAKQNIEDGKITERVKKLNGHYRHVRNDGKISRYDCSKYEYLLKSPFKISEQCCDVMKKNPAKKFEKETGRRAILGIMAEESQLRRTQWFKTGCNAFDSKRQISKPMSFWTEQDVLEYIVKFNLDYAKVYGEIVFDGEKYSTTGVNRTGCMFCMFGCHLEKEPNRFQKLEQTHPKQYAWCIGGGTVIDGKLVPDKNGLGLGKILDFIGVNYKND